MVGPIRIRSKAANVDREPFFYIDDEEYTIPKVISPAVAMRFMDRLADGMSDEKAVSLMLREVLGAKAVKALGQAEGMTSEDMANIISVVREKAMSSGLNDEGKASDSSVPKTHSYDG